MARNGSGTYNLPAGNPVTTGTTISSTWANSTLSDMATALTGSIASDGQTTASGNLPMGGFIHTNVGNATVRANYASAGQVQDGGLTYLTTVSGADTITAVGAVGMTAYATGQQFTFVAAGTNTGAATININSIGAKSIVKTNGTALSAGDIASGAAVQLVYDGTNFQFANKAISTASGDVTGPASSTDNAIVRFDSTTGKIIQNSVVTIADTTGDMTGVGNLTTTGNTTLGNASTDTLNVGNGGIVKDSSGLVGIGNSSMSSFNSNYNNLVVGSGSGTEGLAIYAGSANSAYIGLKSVADTSFQGGWEYDFSNNTLFTYTNGVFRSSIDGNGVITFCAIPVSTSAAGADIRVSGNQCYMRMSHGSQTSTAEYFYFYNGNGLVGSISANGSTTTYATSSDYRLKDNVAPMTNALDTVSLLKPVTYTWKVDGSVGQGFIAHELAEVVPDCVTGQKDAVNEDGSIKAQGIDTSYLVATLTAAIQELKAIVDAQAQEIKALQSK